MMTGASTPGNLSGVAAVAAAAKMRAIIRILQCSRKYLTAVGGAPSIRDPRVSVRCHRAPGAVSPPRRRVRARARTEPRARRFAADGPRRAGRGGDGGRVQQSDG